MFGNKERRINPLRQGAISGLFYSIYKFLYETYWDF